ncbi:MAG TPA: transketolase [Thermodesulfobacteriota bacterium]|nr:transketolase [Thermodesulfobacteriota bacterium]
MSGAIPLALECIREKADWVRRQTLLLHRRSPETRLASSLSCVEILTVLYYGGFIRFDALEPLREDRDRLVISKGHGSISFFPILSDLGFIDSSELDKIARPDGILKAIPDPLIPGYETLNGSLGQGLGVACGMALGIKHRGTGQKVFVLSGDGELYEGSVWEAAMFAAHHRLGDLVMIIDNNGRSMLDYCRNIMDLGPLDALFRAFGWETLVVDGHDIGALATCYREALANRSGRPCVVVANTVKGKGVPSLEGDALAHIRMLAPLEVDRILECANGE